MSKRLFIGMFEREEDIVGVTTAVRERGFEIQEVYTPFAVHGLDKAMGLKPSRLPLVCLLFGLIGATAKLWFQIWTSAQSWPVNVGGKPLASVPAFVPVTFEITVLFAGLGTVAAFFLISKLLPGKRPKVILDRVTDDRFALVLVEHDSAFDTDEAKRICSEYNSVHIEERDVEDENDP